MYKFNKACVYKGRASQIAVVFVDENGVNLHTCGMTASTIRIENEDGSFIEKVAGSGISWGAPDQTYLHLYDFTPEETALFKKGLERSIFLKISFGTPFLKFEFKKFLNVYEDLF